MPVWNYVHRPQHFLISHAWCCDLMWGKARICFNLFCTINFIGWCWQLLLVYPLDPSDYFLPCVLIANLSVYNLRPKVHVDHIPTLMWALHYVHLYSFQRTSQSIWCQPLQFMMLVLVFIHRQMTQLCLQCCIDVFLFTFSLWIAFCGGKCSKEVSESTCSLVNYRVNALVVEALITSSRKRFFNPHGQRLATSFTPFGA